MKNSYMSHNTLPYSTGIFVYQWDRFSHMIQTAITGRWLQEEMCERWNRVSNTNWIIEKLGYAVVKDEKEFAIQNTVEGRDVFINQPTGFRNFLCNYYLRLQLHKSILSCHLWLVCLVLLTFASVWQLYQSQILMDVLHYFWLLPYNV